MARWVCAPQRAVVGTSSGPILSCSTRGAVVIAPYSAGFRSFTVISSKSNTEYTHPPMPDTAIDALSPLDGRSAGNLAAVRHLFSEAGLMRERVRVECAWMLALAAGPAAAGLAALPRDARLWLESLAKNPAGTDVLAIKGIESRTNHDVKAVEYWIRAQLQAHGALPAQLEWVHFACTSEDINNLAY